MLWAERFVCCCVWVSSFSSGGDGVAAGPFAQNTDSVWNEGNKIVNRFGERAKWIENTVENTEPNCWQVAKKVCAFRLMPTTRTSANVAFFSRLPLSCHAPLLSPRRIPHSSTLSPLTPISDAERRPKIALFSEGRFDLVLRTHSERKKLFRFESTTRGIQKS